MSQVKLEDKNEWISVEGPFVAKDLRLLSNYSRIEKLSLVQQPLVTAKIAKGLSSLQSVNWLWLWCSVTRTAMRHVISIPYLETLDILEIKAPGSLNNFADARNLRVFRCNHYMTEADLLEIAKSPMLREVGAQNSAITIRALDSLLHMTDLEQLDLEATEFDDDMASIVAESKSLQHLDVGASRLTSKGLKKISEMSQLRSLDIWAIDLVESDLDLLSKLSNLEYLSIGGYEDQSVFTSNGVIPRLKEIPSLKRIWLDGITLTKDERLALDKHFEYVRS